MKDNLFRYIVWFLILVFLQVTIFRNINFSWENFNYIHLFVYPIFILMLPLRTSTSTILLCAFLMGLMVDIFYDSPGVHTSALLFMGFMRPIVLNLMEPREGYSVNAMPTIKEQGLTWYLIYSSILYFLFLFFYFSVETFTFAYFFSIWLKTIFSLVFSYIFIIIHQVLIES